MGTARRYRRLCITDIRLLYDATNRRWRSEYEAETPVKVADSSHDGWKGADFTFSDSEGINSECVYDLAHVY